MTPPRWRVDCRKQRGPWRTVQYEGYALWCEAVTAWLVHLLTEEWDEVRVVPIGEAHGQERRMVAAGATYQVNTSPGHAHDMDRGSNRNVDDGEQRYG